MDQESRATHVDRFLEQARAAALFRQLGKSNRRRVLVDPSSEIFKTRRFGHCCGYWTKTLICADVLWRPLASVTVSEIFQVPAVPGVLPAPGVNELIGLDPPICVVAVAGFVML